MHGAAARASIDLHVIVFAVMLHVWERSNGWLAGWASRERMLVRVSTLWCPSTLS